MRHLALLLALTLLALAPPAVADGAEASKNETRPDDAAWVDDCPPDRMCAFVAEDCIDCAGPADGADTCMDGEQGEEACRDDVTYLDGGASRGPADGSCPECRGPAEGAPVRVERDESIQTVPALAIGGILFVAAIAVVMRRPA